MIIIFWEMTPTFRRIVSPPSSGCTSASWLQSEVVSTCIGTDSYESPTSLCLYKCLQLRSVTSSHSCTAVETSNLTWYRIPWPGELLPTSQEGSVSWRLVQSVWTIWTLDGGCIWHTLGISLSSFESTENWVEYGDKFMLFVPKADVAAIHFYSSSAACSSQKLGLCATDIFVN
jgi:hypothetical protein